MGAQNVETMLGRIAVAVESALTTAIAAGAAILGKVGIDQTTPGTSNGVVVNSGSLTSQGYTAAVTVTRPANTTAYTGNDVLGAAAAAITFPSIGPNAGVIQITGAELEADIAAIPAGMTSFNLYLYSVTPPSALADNAAFDIVAGDRASFVGKIALGAPVDEGSTLYVRTNGINADIKLAGTSLFGYLVTAAGFTPAANSEVYKVTLHAKAL